MPLSEQVGEDYRSLSLSLKAHPVSFMRELLSEDGVVSNARLIDLPADRYVTVSGLVLIRQRPGTASGVIFITIEDETGVANLVIWPDVFERNRRAVLSADFVVVRGRLQREGTVIHIIVNGIYDHSERLHAVLHPSANAAALTVRSRDFR
jgi:error-prone DNA polymerase